MPPTMGRSIRRGEYREARPLPFLSLLRALMDGIRIMWISRMQIILGEVEDNVLYIVSNQD